MDAVTGEASVAAGVARTARMLARMGLVEGFGHVSARAGEDAFALTSVDPLCAQDETTVLLLDLDAQVRGGDASVCPLEAPLHAAIYRRRPDVRAICRTHSRHAAAWACRRQAPPQAHGLGGLSGAVAVHDEIELVATREQAEAASAALGAASCLLLAANGALSVGGDLPEAIVRAWYLEERSELATLAADAPPIASESALRRERHHAAEARRAWRWLDARFGAEDGR
ncbi:MAG TPA: class II aldolase/adducin family protein [Conexibacter sp.]|nr:class II aldolase/adducin family protein [Conexibacter sp.]